MQRTPTSRTHQTLMTSIVVAALLLTAGCTPGGSGPTEQTNDPKPPPMNAIVAGGSNFDTFFRVAVASDGSMIAVGNTMSTDGDFPPSHGDEDAVIVKYAPDGTQVWAKTTGGSGIETFVGVALAGDGSIIAVGLTWSTDGDFPPSHGKQDALIAKYSPDGTQEWAKTTGGSDDEEFSSVAVAGDGSIIVAGYTRSTDGDLPPSRGENDALIAKYSPDGTRQWAKTTGGSDSDAFWGVAVAGDGSIIAAGGHTGSTDGDGSPTPSKADSLIVKYSPDGTQEWAKTTGGSDDDQFLEIAVDGDGGIIAVGYASSTDGGFPPSHGKKDALIAKYSPDGTQQWARTSGGRDEDSFSGIAVATDGSLIAAGHTQSTGGDFSPSHGDDDALIVKYSPDGTRNWAKTAGGSDSDYLIGVATASGGKILAAGWTYSEDGPFPVIHGWSDALLLIVSPDA